MTVKSHRVHKSFDLLSFEGYDSINDVEPFKGAMLKVPESQLGELAEGEYYFHEIIGCTVVTEEGETIGTVREILRRGRTTSGSSGAATAPMRSFRTSTKSFFASIRRKNDHHPTDGRAA